MQISDLYTFFDDKFDLVDLERLKPGMKSSIFLFYKFCCFFGLKLNVYQGSNANLYHG